MAAADLLIELFTEELPPKALKKLADSFASSIALELEKLHLTSSKDYQAFATPRRLAVLVKQVSSQAESRKVTVKGPSVKVGLDDQGKPTQALEKWAQKQGVAVSDLTQESDGKQDNFYAKLTQPGAFLASSVESVVQEALAQLPIPKVMQYQLADGLTDVSFIRPAHGFIVLHGNQLLPCSVLGLASSTQTLGHRFLSHDQITIGHTHEYVAKLHSAKVIADFEQRSQSIAAQLDAAASACNSQLSDDPAVSNMAALEGPLAGYLDEVTALVEWPKVYTGQFASGFLQVPQECLILTMRTNQKYFPLFDAGKLTNRFLIVSNMDIADPRNIIDGNEKVIRPRLSDAQFFFEQDKKQPLASHLPALESVVYHAKLGSQAARMKRVTSLAAHIAQHIGADNAMAQRAAQLAKCDLVTGMVGEFPELQGVMGRYYARHDKEPEAVASAIAEQYMPRFAGDQLPHTPVGTALALADKLETLCGIWGVGQMPTGDKDPFALRRHALGIARMLLEKKLPLKLTPLLEFALKQFSTVAGFTFDANAITQFVMERLRHLLREMGHSPAAIEAVLAVNADDLLTVVPRLEAVNAFGLLPDAQNLAAANKRIGNILRKARDANQTIPAQVEPAALIEPAEQQLHSTLLQVEPLVKQHFQTGRYTEALQALAQLRAPVDQFFADVMVNAAQENTRQNRYSLLQHAHGLMNQIADLGRLAT